MDWKGLRGARIFLTGGTGFFGIWLLETALEANREFGLGLEITALSRDPKAFLAKHPHLGKESALKFHPGDVRNFEIPKAPFTHVIHGAATAAVNLKDQNPRTIVETIVEGTKRVLSLAKESGAQRFLFISSGAVYGKSEATLVSEETPLNPMTAYGKGKRDAEALCADIASIARCFAFVGPHLPLDSYYAIGNFIGNAIRNEPIRVAGDGTAVRSYLYASELADWLWTILEKGKPGRAYNVGSEDPFSIRELAEEVARALQLGKSVEVAGTDSGGTPDRYVPSTARARAELGLKQTISLAESIRRTADWYKNHV